ncbi:MULTISPECIES: hypothetical protein [unclassified Bradyrhizobium]|uniref:hypothetical protein n=1 Tax=unclassified Bradyrhizobium TaxID=2631580 RepID=UPI00211E8486|nr:MULTISPECIES: hypothetical protein [unclassified Bradyrhizobium]MDD1534550.1 hypothetical protein [Bradyrhizobium sp. WBOS8]MDD1581414.1 hypothetical protein [Bradyrhizobium sp. WBOS4]UUO49704.1 hypothetical protein DCM78_24015 [Bradyrhizobium sp. WBOS04]UUO58469.1 hypothetical protein DCM80_04290 [Bradyrhizobium sp. WBOS08]
MKLVIDPMPALRAVAVMQINTHFNGIAQANLHREQAHAAKRQAAARLLAGSPETSLDAEAALRGLRPIDLAALIAGKSDDLQERESARQRALHLIAQATTPAALDEIVANVGTV